MRPATATRCWPTRPSPAGQSCGGITITTPALFAAGDQLVRATTPYAIEIRAELCTVAATFSHYDLFLSTDGPAAVGESFTNRIDDTWTFRQRRRAPGVSDFAVHQHHRPHHQGDHDDVLSHLGSTPVSITQNLRGVLPRADQRQEGRGPARGHLRRAGRGPGARSWRCCRTSTRTPGWPAATGTPGGGDVRGAIPEGQVGINSVSEIIGVVNPGTSSATVTFSFLFQSGTAYRTVLTVPAQRRAQLDVMALPNFPVGEPYSVFFESTRPVTLNLPTDAFGDEFASEFSDKAYTLWGFGEGFRPKREGVVTEYLRLFNPQEGDVLVEITLHFDGGLGEETFRRTLPARRVQEFDVHDFVTGDKRNKKVFYGITVKAAQPVVAYMAHYDSFFPGGFGTLGAPLGTSVGV
ncbi:MAG: hypothetical protein H6811_07230 [Phycisphaeraceae bacterium]|nr:hypothetical protein [Phycisphaeraceae bacterium]